jgi:uncharacterized protein (DUF1330 family)
MKVQNELTPQNPANIQAFLACEGPVCMVNLLKFREKAEYEDGRETDLTGQEAYMLYGAEMRKLVEASGGRFIFSATVNSLLLGEVEDLWDVIGIVEYSSSKALMEISSSPEFQAIEVHRHAGLEGQLNITTQEGGL